MLDKYYTIKSIYAKLFSSSSSNSNQTNTSPTSPNVKLPKISLPVFDGNYNSWLTFFDLFSTLIDKNSALSDIEKFQYLLSSLSSHALTLIKGIPITSQNYATAFKTLTDRYQNRRLLANSCWQAIITAAKLNNDAAAGLRQLLEIFEENLASLKNLQLPVDDWDFVLFHILIQKLDTATIKRFELQEASTEIPSFSKLKDFLKRQCTALEHVALSVSHQKTFKAITESSSNRNSNINSRSAHPKFSSSLFAQSSSSSKVNSCNFCKSSHSIYRCPTFFSKTPSDRLHIAKDRKWCTNCLHSGHRINVCSSQSTCRFCQGKHHTLLHIPRDVSAPLTHSQITNQNSSSSESRDSASSSEIPVAQVHSLTNVFHSNSVVLLSTAKVEVLDAWGKYQSVRVLLDGGSQANVISRQCARRLGLKTSQISMSIFGLGQTPSSTSSCVVCILRPLGKTYPTFTIDALVLPKICTPMPNSNISVEGWKHISNLKLADPQFNIPSEVDMLLGADIFSKILDDGKLPGTHNEPTAINTVFGWILMGKIQNSPSSEVNSLLISNESSLNFILKNFWELEEVPKTQIASPDDSLCETLYKRNVSRDSTGRYTVSLPFKEEEPSFLDSRSIALRRFLSLEQRLLNNSQLYSSYCEVMREYLTSGHMKVVSSNDVVSNSVYYIPHHGVVKPESTTTKLRVVFDASTKDAQGISLNDTLLTGPKLQKDIGTILLRFRFHQYVFTADIKNMYRQILITPNHTNYQRILWRFSPNDPIQDFCLNTVAFGVSSAPYLALRTINQLAHDEQNNFPLASRILTTDVFVDDIVTGCSTINDVKELQSQLISLLNSGGFQLRKWTSNNSSILENISSCDRHENCLSFDAEENSVKILGLKWHPHSDSFFYSVDVLDRPCTKRILLSELARIFDPLGFLSPITFYTKYLIQYLWTLGLEWDQSPPSEVLQRWRQYKSQLSCLQNLKIPRHCVPVTFQKCQLHGFCDSSEKGYSALIYLRFQLPGDSIYISLICAKSKVAPLKRISLPRLELCAALLLSQLVSYVVEIYSPILPLSDIFAWSDSMVTLAWIKSSPHRFKTFVSNRVSQIQDKISPNRWFHVSSGDNPADCASRGLLPAELLDHPLWWAGPSWLKLPSNYWPITSFTAPPDSSSWLEEERKIVLSQFILLDSLDTLLENFSSLAKIKRIISYCLRYIKNSRNPDTKTCGAFAAHELHEALFVLVKRVQYSSFSDVIQNLQKGKPIPKCLRKLSPFLGADGVLRVGGRLTHSGLLYDQKFPALLPRKHRLTELIIEEVHKDNLHPGLQTLHFLISRHFWILSPRRAIRHTLSKCYRCFRVNPTPYQPPMGNLPSLRVNQLKPFSCVGTDFAGPFFITMGKSRGIKSQKAYLCLFVCFATKAVHLELASDLTTECFLASLRRFVSRRGRCSHIFSDRGSNYIGAERELIQLMQQASESEKISWSFNAPSSPHFGGLWESSVKGVKTHLIRVVGNQILTYEEFNTILVQIEALLNSRPLCPLSSDPHDLSVLTPGHFLTLEPLTSVPNPDLSHLSLNRLSRWQLLQRMQQDFWRRWHLEYLNTLQQRQKWFSTNFPKVSPGTLVLIKDEQAPPLTWRLARIEKIHPGKDGVCRVATVRTTNGSMQRPLVKLCPLPVSETDDQ